MGDFSSKIIFKVSADHVCCCRFAQGLRAQALTQSLLLKFESKYLLAFCLPLMRVQRSYVRRFHILSSHQMTFNFFQRLFLTHKIFLPNWCLKNSPIFQKIIVEKLTNLFSKIMTENSPISTFWNWNCLTKLFLHNPNSPLFCFLKIIAKILSQYFRLNSSLKLSQFLLSQNYCWKYFLKLRL